MTNEFHPPHTPEHAKELRIKAVMNSVEMALRSPDSRIAALAKDLSQYDEELAYALVLFRAVKKHSHEHFSAILSAMTKASMGTKGFDQSVAGRALEKALETDERGGL